MEEEITTDKILEKADSLYKFFDNSFKYIKDYSNKYEITESYCNKILTIEKDNSFKTILTDLTNKDLINANNLINHYHNKIMNVRNFILSEIAHTKSKEIDFQITNPFFFQKLRKDYRKLINELDKLDEEGITRIEDIDKFNLKFENLIERLRNLEYEIEDEKKSGLFNTVGKIAVWGIPIIIGIYQLIAMNFFIVNPYLPLIFYSIGLFLTYLFLKSIDVIRFFWMSFKFRNTKYQNISSFMVVITLITLIYTFVNAMSLDNIASDKSLLVILLSSGILALLGLIIITKDIIETTKKNLIKNIIMDNARKYGL